MKVDTDLFSGHSQLKRVVLEVQFGDFLPGDNSRCRCSTVRESVKSQQFVLVDELLPQIFSHQRSVLVDVDADRTRTQEVLRLVSPLTTNRGKEDKS